MKGIFKNLNRKKEADRRTYNHRFIKGTSLIFLSVTVEVVEQNKTDTAQGG